MQINPTIIEMKILNSEEYKNINFSACLRAISDNQIEVLIVDSSPFSIGNVYFSILNVDTLSDADISNLLMNKSFKEIVLCNSKEYIQSFINTFKSKITNEHKLLLEIED